LNFLDHPFRTAVEEGHMSVVDYYARQNLNLNYQDYFGLSHLHSAVENGHYHLVEYLVSNGADINIKNKADLFSFI